MAPGMVTYFFQVGCRLLLAAVLVALATGCSESILHTTESPPLLEDLVEERIDGLSPPTEPFRDCPDICPEMVPIRGHQLAVGRYEITFSEWDACVAAGGCDGYLPNDEGWGRGSRPVVNVSWNDATNYVRWLSERTGEQYRLLTSADWEVSAPVRGLTRFAWGAEYPVCEFGSFNGANVEGCAVGGTQPVGSYQPNEFGLFDVHGNVWELTDDCYHSQCEYRFVRGGGWNSAPYFVYGAGRGPSDRRSNELGFRVARSL